VHEVNARDTADKGSCAKYFHHSRSHIKSDRNRNPTRMFPRLHRNITETLNEYFNFPCHLADSQTLLKDCYRKPTLHSLIQQYHMHVCKYVSLQQYINVSISRYTDPFFFFLHSINQQGTPQILCRMAYRIWAAPFLTGELVHIAGSL